LRGVAAAEPVAVVRFFVAGFGGFGGTDPSSDSNRGDGNIT
jgi:hypothetical protein